MGGLPVTGSRDSLGIQRVAAHQAVRAKLPHIAGPNHGLGGLVGSLILVAAGRLLGQAQVAVNFLVAEAGQRQRVAVALEVAQL